MQRARVDNGVCFRPGGCADAGIRRTDAAGGATRMASNVRPLERIERRPDSVLRFDRSGQRRAIVLAAELASLIPELIIH